MKEKPNIVRDKSFDFALEIIQLYKELVKNKEFILSRQLLKSGTSIGANINESTAAQTKKEFISKMSVASKEARETLYWLCLLDKSDLVPLDYKPYLSKSNEIVRLLTAIVKTAQQNS